MRMLEMEGYMRRVQLREQYSTPAGLVGHIESECGQFPPHTIEELLVMAEEIIGDEIVLL